jgi:hypothetical protein
VGEAVGTNVGDNVGETLGTPVGETEGVEIGDTVGEALGEEVGAGVSHIFPVEQMLLLQSLSIRHFLPASQARQSPTHLISLSRPPASPFVHVDRVGEGEGKEVGRIDGEAVGAGVG